MESDISTFDIPPGNYNAEQVRVIANQIAEQRMTRGQVADLYKIIKGQVESFRELIAGLAQSNEKILTLLSRIEMVQKELLSHKSDFDVTKKDHEDRLQHHERQIPINLPDRLYLVERSIPENLTNRLVGAETKISNAQTALAVSGIIMVLVQALVAVIYLSAREDIRELKIISSELSQANLKSIARSDANAARLTNIERKVGP